MILLFIGFGMWVVDGANWQPFIPPNTGEFGQFGWSGVVQAAGMIFFAYIGFDAVSTAAQEAKNPQRDMPIGILACLAVCTVLYIAVAAVLTGMVPYTRAQHAGTRSRSRSTVTRSSPGWPAGQARRHRRPDLGDAGDAARPAAHLLRDVARRPAAAAVPPGAPDAQDAVRRHDHDRHARRADRRPVPDGDPGRAGVDRHAARLRDGLHRRAGAALHAPRPPAAVQGARAVVVCIAGALVCTLMMLSLPQDTWVRLLVWTAIGFLIYFFYGFRHSELRKQDAEARRRAPDGDVHPAWTRRVSPGVYPVNWTTGRSVQDAAWASWASNSLGGR